jgi:hypothetical protein
MVHQHGRGKPFDYFDEAPLFTGSIAEATATLHAEVDQALALAVLPWECDLHRRLHASAVRAGVRAHLAGVVAPEKLHDVLLVVRELVDNAYQHTDSPRRLWVGRRGCTVRIEVSDGAPGHPALISPSPSDRGISLVHGVSDAWGVQPDEDGKTVWAELTGHS